MAEISPIERKTLTNQTINLSFFKQAKDLELFFITGKQNKNIYP